MKNFAITGAAGYVAPRHLKAIKETGNQLLAAVDPFDSVGILDSFFPDCAFFTEYERFDRHLEKLKHKPESERVHFLSICSPNHLHDAHIRSALRCRADAICEKPLVLNPWNLDALKELEAESGQRVWTVLQLRVHPSLIALKERLDSEKHEKHQVLLTYVTSRGQWYLRSWKGILEKSGGVASNIGVHFFDMLTWLFGDLESMETHISDARTCSGVLELEKASIKWFLSIDIKYVPEESQKSGQRTFRSITLDDEEIEFSGGFNDLHNEIYRRTLSGEGFGLEDTRKAIEIVHRIRTEPPIGIKPNSHPFLNTL
jgi:UDP-N-acetyl-2-amino-2-deoxyglucuronate dehydrogenase